MSGFLSSGLFIDDGSRMTDLELLEQFKSGSSEAFAALVNRHIHWVRSAALRRVRDPHMADDVTQAVFILLGRKARSMRPGSVLGAWLFEAVRYSAATALRTERRRRHHEQK